MVELNNRKQESDIHLYKKNHWPQIYIPLKLYFLLNPQFWYPYEWNHSNNNVHMLTKDLLPSARPGQMTLWKEWRTSSWSRWSLETTRGKRQPTLSSTSIRAPSGYLSGTCQSWAAITMSRPPHTLSWLTPSKTYCPPNRMRQWRPRGDT